MPDAAFKTLDEAFIAAQAAMDQPKKTAENPHFHSKFAPLDECIAVSVPVLNAHGIGLSQPTVSLDGRIGIRTIIFGYGEERDLGLLMGTPPDDPQKIGSWLTYFRRYGLSAALAQAAETDDDANTASAPKAAAKPAGVASESQIKAVWGKAKAAGITAEQLHAGIKRDFGKEHVDMLTKAEASALLDKLAKVEAPQDTAPVIGEDDIDF